MFSTESSAVVAFLALCFTILQLTSAQRGNAPVMSCSTNPCVSTDYRQFTRCLTNQCGPTCPSSYCGATNCNTCRYNQNGPCCSSCCQPQPMPIMPSPCQQVPSWPYVRCPSLVRPPCQGMGCYQPMPMPQPMPIPLPMPCQGMGCNSGWGGWTGSGVPYANAPSASGVAYGAGSSPCGNRGSCG